jgi:CHAT domain-containing protein
MLHFSGHAEFDDYAPENHALMFADGPLTAAGFMKLEWKNGPPYFVFAGACQSGRGEGGKRLVSGEAQSNGLAAAFLTIGVYAYAGFFWPVDEDSATLFTSAFYNELFTVENIGLAFKSARNYVFRKLWNSGDLTAFSAILFGDAGSEHRQDIVELV